MPEVFQEAILQVLLLEDEAVISEFVCLVLQDHGYRVLSFANGEDAMDARIQTTPAAMVVDVILPGGMTGFEYVDQVRTRWPHSGVVFITGNRAHITERRLDDNERFLPKPFGAEALLDALRSVVDTPGRRADAP